MIDNTSALNEETSLLQIEQLQKEREAVKEVLDQLDQKISLHTSKLSQIGRTKETEEELIAKMERLELKHETTTQSSVDERNFIRDLNKLKEQKKKLIEYNSIQSELDDIKSQRKLKYAELKSIEKRIDEIQLALRKLKLVANIKCDASSLIEHRLIVPQLKMSHIIGKNRQQLTQLEKSCGVSIKIENRSGSSVDEGSLTILGTEATINSAIDKINDIINTDVDEFECRDETIVSLILNKFSLLHSIQLKHDVKIDISRAKKVCKISGFNENRVAAKNEILSIDSAKTVLNVESSMVPAIFGKHGATISALSSENNVEINVDKDLNTICILGVRNNVNQTVSQINRIIDENKEVVEVIEGSKSVILGCFIGNQGAIVKQLEKDLGVYLHHEEGDDAKPFRLIVRGNVSKILTAKLHLEQMLKNYTNDIDCIVVPESCIPPLLGKSNKNSLSELRKDHTDTKIDLEGKEIKIFSTNPASRQKVKDRLRQLFSENHSVKIDCSVDTAIQLKSAKSVELRKTLQTELNLNVDIDSECVSITLRGTVENINRGILLLEELKQQTYQEEFPINPDDEKALQSGGVNCAAKDFELQYNVTVYINRKDGIVRIRGLQSDVTKAKLAITGFLNGDIAFGSILLDINPLAYSSVIGTEGNNLKSLEKKHNVQIDVLKSMNKLRLRGTKEALLGARRGILSFLSDLRHAVSIKSDLSALDAAAFTDLVNTITSLYTVEINSDIEKRKLQIRGLLHEVASIEGHVECILANTDKFTLAAYDRHVKYVEQYKSTEPFQKLERKYSLQFITNNSTACEITLQSSSANLEAAKKDFFKLMDSAFPLEFLSVAMSIPCISFITSPVVIDELNSVADTRLSIDRKCSCIRVCGNVESVKKLTLLVKEKVKNWDLLHDKVAIEEFMLPIILGKGKYSVKEIESQLNAKLKVNKNSLSLEIQASSPSHLQSCLSKISQVISQINREHAEVAIDPQLLSTFIGSNGSNIKKLQEQTGVSINVDKKKNGTIILEGSEDKVLAAKQTVMEFIQRETENKNTIEIAVPPGAISIIIGHKGATVNKLSESSGAKINVDKNTNNILIRGPKTACNLCVESINSLLNAEGLSNATPIHTEVKKPVLVVESDGDENPKEATTQVKKIPVGCNPVLIEKQLSKSAQRRLRRKNNKKSNEDNEDNEELDADTFDHKVMDTVSDETVAPETKVPVNTFSPPVSVKANDDPSTHYVSKRGFSIRL